MQLSRRARILAALTLVGALGLTGCGDDDETPAASGDATTTTEATDTAEGDEEAEGEEVEVTGIDYAFERIPSNPELGTTFTFANGSENEPHELVLFHIPDSEERSIQELLELPEEEAIKAVGARVGVAFAAQPGEPGEVVEGDLTLDKAGRYAAICFISVGSTPEQAMEGPPQEGAEGEQPSGPPHFAEGMLEEFTVE